MMMNLHFPRRVPARWLIAVLMGLGLPVLRSAVETETVEMSSAQMDEALAGKMTKTYIVLSKEEVVDMEGRHFAPAQTKAYLKKVKPGKKAVFVFLLADDSVFDTARSVIEVFGSYGAREFAVRRLERAGTTVEAPADRDGDASGKTVLKLVGTPNPAASSHNDAPPAMAARPKSLRPGALPPRVRYAFAADETVVEAAAATERLLLAPGVPDYGAHFETTVMILAGAWRHLSEVAELKETKPLISHVEMGSRVVELEGRFLGAPDEFAKSAGRIRELLAADGGGTVRALSSAEMDRWWTFIGFDIEEPVFAVESKGGSYSFVVCWLRNHVFAFDELKALPAR